MEQVFHRCAFFGADKEDAKQREEHAYGCDEHRGNNGLQLHVGSHGKGGGSKGSCGEDGSAIALIEVGTHTRYVAYVVAYVVGNGGGIARVVFRNVGFHLTHDVGTYVSSFCIDSATYTGKECLSGCTHTEGQHGRGNGDECHLCALIEGIEDDEPDGNVEQA